MNAACKWVGLSLGAILVVLAVTAALQPNRAETVKKDPGPIPWGLRAEDPQAPLLLDASSKVAGDAAPRRGNPPQRPALIVPRPGRMRVDMDILVDGRPLPTVRHGGKTYLPVPRMGEEYQIRVWSHGPHRVAAVVSVDCLSVITGQPASENGPGYLVAPYSHIVIKGWRRSLDNVAAFRFVDREQSYAGLMGKPENIGVIGLVAFEERILDPMPRLERREAVPAAKGERTEVGSIGTEYGREIDSRAYYVPFVRSRHKQTIPLYYDTVEALRAAGVPVDQPSPNPFPGDIPFAPPPPAYRGKCS